MVFKRYHLSVSSDKEICFVHIFLQCSMNPKKANKIQLLPIQIAVKDGIISQWRLVIHSLAIRCYSELASRKGWITAESKATKSKKLKVMRKKKLF